MDASFLHLIWSGTKLIVVDDERLGMYIVITKTTIEK